MTRLLYLRLACNNLWKNRQSYIPFLFASVMLTFTLYSFSSIALNPGLSNLPGGVAFASLLVFGLIVVGLFTAIFLFYANSFLIKRRKKELGLYSILGMEKKHISRVIRHELSLCYLLSMLLGLGLGILLSRLLFLLVGLIIQVETPMVGSVNAIAMLLTLALFAALYLLLMLYNSRQVRSVSPISLLHGSQTGEKEPKSRWPLAIIGLAAMISGYVIAQRVESPMAAIALFFIAVVLVIIGTYCLFLAGTLTILKLLKNNQKIYYRPRNFITISGMLYRMKQNAAGLASIAILCTMAMVTIGTTIALYNGAEKTLDGLYPSDLKMNVSSAEELEQARATAEACAQEQGVALRNLKAFESYETTLALDHGQIKRTYDIPLTGLDDYNKFLSISILTESTFAALQENDFSLDAGEMGWYCMDASLQPPASVTLGTVTYDFRALDNLSFRFRPSATYSSSLNTACIIVKDEADATALLSTLGEKEEDITRKIYTLQVDVKGTEEQTEAYTTLLTERFTDHRNLFVKSKQRAQMYGLYGGFLFIGIFLGTLFLMATALIIYFKQISEGYQDHDRFIILQKVGMSEREVRRTVQTQILIVFFMPLVVAVCHVAGSLHMIVLMLRVMAVADAAYITLNTFGAAAGVAVLYSGFYLKTAKTYFRLVQFQ